MGINFQELVGVDYSSYDSARHAIEDQLAARLGVDRAMFVDSAMWEGTCLCYCEC